MTAFDDFKFKRGDLVEFALQSGRDCWRRTVGRVNGRKLTECADGRVAATYTVLFDEAGGVHPWECFEFDLVPHTPGTEE